MQSSVTVARCNDSEEHCDGERRQRAGENKFKFVGDEHASKSGASADADSVGALPAPPPHIGLSASVTRAERSEVFFDKTYSPALSVSRTTLKVINADI